MKKRILMLLLAIGIVISGCGKQEIEIDSEIQTSEEPIKETEQNCFSGHEISNAMETMLAATEEESIAIRASLEHDVLNQTEMNLKAKELYDTWDHALNTLWNELKEELSEDEFAKLLDEQRAWISEKETAVEEAGKEVEGGSMYPLVVNMKAAEITEERVYELYEMLK